MIDDNIRNTKGVMSVDTFIELMIKYNDVFMCADALLNIKKKIIVMTKARRLPNEEDKHAMNALANAILFLNDECQKYLVDLNQSMDNPNNEEMN